MADARLSSAQRAPRVAEARATYASEVNLEEWAKILEGQMEEAASKLDFERAARLRDELRTVREKLGSEKVG